MKSSKLAFQPQIFFLVAILALKPFVTSAVMFIYSGFAMPKECALWYTLYWFHNLHTHKAWQFLLILCCLCWLCVTSLTIAPLGVRVKITCCRAPQRLSISHNAVTVRYASVNERERTTTASAVTAFCFETFYKENSGVQYWRNCSGLPRSKT